MDIVERLRKAQQTFYGDTSINELHMYAADEIERLREELEDMHRRERPTAVQNLGNEGQLCDEIERLREALQKILDFDQDFFGLDSMDGPCAKIARSALQQKESE